MQTIMDFEDFLRAATQCAMTRYPEETRRILRGLELARKGHVYLYNGYAKVRSQTHSAVLYTVDSKGCNCTDAKAAPDARCKHRVSMWLMKKALLKEAIGPEPRQYYATYTAPDQSLSQGIATWDAGRQCYLFVPDDRSAPLYPASQVLTLGGHVPTAEPQRKEDGDLGEKFGRRQYPDMDHAAIDARLAEKKARRTRSREYGE